MTELSFLLDLLLNHKLSRVTRDAIAARIKEVEGGITSKQSASNRNVGAPFSYTIENPPPQRPARPKTAQAPSTQAILAEKFSPEEAEKMAGGETVELAPIPEQAPVVPPPPTSPLAAQALQQRQAAIMRAVNSGPFGGKPEDGRTSPRKF